MRQIRHYIVLTGLSGLLTLGALTTYAQTVEIVQKAEREVEVVEKGVKVRKVAPVDKIVPGDEVTYTLTYTNKTGKPVTDLAVIDPLPKHTRYKDGTAAGDGAEIQFSVDGGKTYAAPGQLTVAIRDKSGKDIQRPAVAQDYTHIRWVIKPTVAPGQTGSVRFRVVIL